jgi:hypothetical protein
MWDGFDGPMSDGRQFLRSSSISSPYAFGLLRERIAIVMPAILLHPTLNFRDSRTKGVGNFCHRVFVARQELPNWRWGHDRSLTLAVLSSFDQHAWR